MSLVLTAGDDIVPLIGPRVATGWRLAGSLDVKLTDDELATIEQAVPADAAPATLPRTGMTTLDSEK